MHNLRYNVERIKRYCIKHNQDWIFLITGGEGSGKSTLGQHLAEMLDPKFNMKKQMVYSFDEEYSYFDFIKGFRHKPFRAVVFDEAVTALFSRDHAKSEVKDTVKLFNLNRQLNHFSILIVPSFWGMDVDLRERRSRTMLYVFQDQFNFTHKYAYYSRRKIPNISMNSHARKLFLSSSLFIKHFKPDFMETFPKMTAKKEKEYKKFKTNHFDIFVDDLERKYQDKRNKKNKTKTQEIVA